MMPKRLFTIAGSGVHVVDGVVAFAAGMQIDADGAPDAYHPATLESPHGHPPGLDDLRNAGAPGNWYGIATENGRLSGIPVVQGPSDPCPGFYVSTTALQDARQPPRAPRRYVDSSTVPYFVLPHRIGGDAAPTFGRAIFTESTPSILALGDLGMVIHGARSSAAIYADVGPRGHIGEGSIALAKALGIFRGVNVGHDDRDVIYLVWPSTRTSPPWPRPVSDIAEAAGHLFDAWGGMARAGELAPMLIGEAT